MNNMERALYEVGAHIFFKKVKDPEPAKLPRLKHMKVPVVSNMKRKKSKQRIVGGIPLDPINKSSAIVTSKTPRDCKPPSP